MDRQALKPYYADQSVTLYNGDCNRVMAELPENSVDLVFTSPPYNLGVSTGGGLKGAGDGGKWAGAALAAGYEDHDDAMPFEDYVDWQRTVLWHCWRLIKPTGAIYYQHKPRVQAGILQTPFALVPSEMPIRQVIVWDRGSGMNFAPTHYVPAHEWIVIIAGPDFRLKSKGASGLSDVWRANAVTGSRHPAPFPLSLPARAIESTGAQVVLDPFCGSGTTLRAAADAGVKGIGIELTATYCDMAVSRMAQGALDFGEGA